MDEKLIQNPSHLKEKTIYGAIIIFIYVAFFLLRMLTDYAFDILIGTLMVLGAFEVENLMHKMDRPTFKILIGLFPILAFITTILTVNCGLNMFDYLCILLGVLVAIFVLGILYCFIFKKNTRQCMKDDEIQVSITYYAMSKSLNTVFVCIWPSLLFSFAFMINHFGSLSLAQNSTLMECLNSCDIGLFGLVLLFVTTIFADTSAMLVGKTIISPKINMQKLGPGKSWSGLIGGLVGAIVGSILVFIIFNAFDSYKTLFLCADLDILKMILFGLIFGVFAMAGDIFSSLFKRRSGVKDFSQIIPGHGGIMDRINAMLLNSVAVFAFMTLSFI